MKNKFIKAYVINFDTPQSTYVWSTSDHITKQSERISPNHQKYLNFLKKNRKDISFTGQYKAMRTKGMHLCSKGHEWFIQPIHVKRGATCPKCQKKIRDSHGAKFITKLLEKKRIEFVKEFNLKRFGTNRDLFLDFLVCKNHYPLFVIEFNGKQHYYPQRSAFFGGYSGHSERKKRDWIKRKECWSMGLPVIDIPYTESEEQIEYTINYFLEIYKINS